MSTQEPGLSSLESRYQNLKDKAKKFMKVNRRTLASMSNEEFSDFSDDILRLSKEASKLLNAHHNGNKPIPDDFDGLALEIDELSSNVIEVQKKRSIFSRLYYTVASASTPQLYAEYLSKKKNFKDTFNAEIQNINKAWEDKIKKAFEAEPDASIGTKAGFEGRRWGTTYLLTTEQAEELRRKKEAYDRVQATLNTCEQLGLEPKKAYETTKYIIKATAETVQELAEQSVVTTGQAIMVGLGGPVYAGLILAWNATFALLEKGGNLFSRAFATADSAIEQSIMKLGKIKTKGDGSIDWSKEHALKNIGLGALHFLGRSPFWLAKILFSGVAAVTKAVEQSIGKFTKKNLIPFLGFGGTAIAAYFIAITLASVFTFGIPLAITAVGLACAVIGGAIATYMRTKSKAQELANLKLSPEEEAVLMRYDYQQRQKQAAENRVEQRPPSSPDKTSELGQKFTKAHTTLEQHHKNKEKEKEGLNANNSTPLRLTETSKSENLETSEKSPTSEPNDQNRPTITSKK